MLRIKIVPTILLTLSLINFVLAAPVVPQEARQEWVDSADVPEYLLPMSQSEKRSDKVENPSDNYSNGPWQKRGSASSTGPALPVEVGDPPADPELAIDPPSSPAPAPSPQTGTSAIQGAAAAASPPDIKPPPSDENTPNDHASDIGGPGSSANIAAPEVGPSNQGAVSTNGPGSTVHLPSNRPEMMSTTSPPFPWDPNDWSDTSSEAESKEHIDHASNEGGPTSPANGVAPEVGSDQGAVMGPESTMYSPSNGHRLEKTLTTSSTFLWDPHDWPDSSSEAEPKENFTSKVKTFLGELCSKLKFWPRGPREF